jgi:hypothetical protein
MRSAHRSQPLLIVRLVFRHNCQRANSSAEAARRKTDDDTPSLSVLEVLKSQDAAVSKPLWTLVAIMLFQQLSYVSLVLPLSS